MAEELTQSQAVFGKPTEPATRKSGDVLKEAVKELERHGGLVSNVPQGSAYWDIMGEYRTLLKEEETRALIAYEKKTKVREAERKNAADELEAKHKEEDAKDRAEAYKEAGVTPPAKTEALEKESVKK